MTTKQPTKIVYKESFAQSILSDLATFGFISIAGYFSQGSTLWQIVTGLMFLCFIVFKASAFTGSDKVLRFYSLDELKEWVDEQEHKQ